VSWLKTWWPALAWAVVISGFSTAVFTSEHTSRVIIPILHWLLPHASRSTLNRIHYLIRKCAHFTEYFILSVLVLRGMTGLAFRLGAGGHCDRRLLCFP
jgi:VanZ family protein